MSDRRFDTSDTGAIRRTQSEIDRADWHLGMRQVSSLTKMIGELQAQLVIAQERYDLCRERHEMTTADLVDQGRELAEIKRRLSVVEKLHKGE